MDLKARLVYFYRVPQLTDHPVRPTFDRSKGGGDESRPEGPGFPPAATKTSPSFEPRMDGQRSWIWGVSTASQVNNDAAVDALDLGPANELLIHTLARPFLALM